MKKELIFNEDCFKIKIGTTDKKKTDVIYIEIGSYLSPLEESFSYKQNISKIDNRMESCVNGFVRNNDLYDNNFILISEIADERMIIGKRSYFNLQLFLRTNDRSSNKSFYNYTDEIYNNCTTKIIPCLKQSIKENGFKYYNCRK